MIYGVFGLGLTGVSAIRYLLSESHEVICWADNITNFTPPSGANLIDIQDISWQKCDYILISPGVPMWHNIFKLAAKYNITVISDIELFCQNIRRQKPKSKIIAVTGTNGKSTVVSLMQHGLAKSHNLIAGGNIGRPVLDISLEYDIYILELSSFQLNLLSEDCWFDIGLVLNIKPDHLDYHGTLEHYASSKLKLLKNSKRQILGPILDDINISDINPDAIFDDKKIIFTENSRSLVPITLPPNLKGAHNAANIAACYGICYFLDIEFKFFDNNIIAYSGLPHRMELVCRQGSVSFYNDSKATNCAACWSALSSLDNIRWLAGGVFKESSLESLKKIAVKKVIKGYFFGQSARFFAEYFNEIIECEIYSDLVMATQAAYRDAFDSKQNILLSPACASYDQYKNFNHRGDDFAKIVKELILLDT